MPYLKVKNIELKCLYTQESKIRFSGVLLISILKNCFSLVCSKVTGKSEASGNVKH